MSFLGQTASNRVTEVSEDQEEFDYTERKLIGADIQVAQNSKSGMSPISTGRLMVIKEIPEQLESSVMTTEQEKSMVFKKSDEMKRNRTVLEKEELRKGRKKSMF